MPQTPYHLYRTTNDNGESFESEVLQDVVDWRNANAEGKPIWDITIQTNTYHDVAYGNETHSFLYLPAAEAHRDRHAPGSIIGTHTEDYEVEPFALVEEE